MSDDHFLEDKKQPESPDHVICPVCYEIMSGPGVKTPEMALPCGHTLCHDCMEKCRERSGKCPQCSRPIIDSIKNFGIVSTVDSWLEEHKQIQFSVELEDKTIGCRMRKSATLARVKELVASSEGRNGNELAFVSSDGNEVRLQDSLTLQECGIPNGGTLRLQ
jgi:hypothetical protein